MMRTSRFLTLSFLLFIGTIGDSREAVWYGLISEDGPDSVRIEEPSLCGMSLGFRTIQTIEGELAGDLLPFAGRVRAVCRDRDGAWGCRSEEEAGAGSSAPDHRTAVLAKVKGEITKAPSQTETGGPTPTEPGVRITRFVMRAGRLETIEFVSDEWLECWAKARDLLPKEEFSITGDVPRGQAKYLAPKVLRLLDRMRKARPVPEELASEVLGLQPGAIIIETFQQREEQIIHRWLERLIEKHDLDRREFTSLGHAPPSVRDVQRWFVEAEDRGSFIQRVRSEWHGDLRDVILVHHQRIPGVLTSWVAVSAERIAEDWTDEEFTHRKEDSAAALEARGWTKPGIE